MLEGGRRVIGEETARVMKFGTEENMMVEAVFVTPWGKRLSSRREQKSCGPGTKSRGPGVGVSPVAVLIGSCDPQAVGG